MKKLLNILLRESEHPSMMMTYQRKLKGENMAQQQAYQRNSLLTPILAGLAGAGLALLFAPRSGKDTRTMVRDNAHDMKETARHKIDAGKAQAKELKDRLQSIAQTTKRKTKQEMDEMNDNREQITSWEREV